MHATAEVWGESNGGALNIIHDNIYLNVGTHSGNAI